jgi:hypothetical protein
MTNTVAITGMHRSGTSLVASWLHSCGMLLDNGKMMPANVGNTRGYFEDMDFFSLHTDSLKTIHKRSLGWKVITDHSLVFDKPYENRARLLIKERNELFPAWGWKDPRTVLYLEQWKRLIPNLKTILIWRPCTQVVDSLLRRARQSPHPIVEISWLTAIRLWKSYNLLICDYRSRYPDDSVLLSISGIIGHDQIAFQRFSKHLGIDLAYTPMSHVYNQEMFNQSGSEWIISIGCRLAGINKVEERLEDLSAL